MLLLAQLISFNAFAQTDAEYEAALAAIEDGGLYYITTDFEGIKYYLTSAGDLVDDQEFGTLFTLQKATGGSYKTYGFKVNSGGSYFSNPVNSSYTDDIITDTNLHTSTRGDNTWETQVFFLNSEGKYAIRACNCSPASSGWNHVGSFFWTVKMTDSGDVAGYEWDPQYIWMLEKPTDVFLVYSTFNNLVDKYGDHVGDDTGVYMNMGEDFGQHSDWDSWEKFYNLLQEAYAYAEQFDPYDEYKWIGDGECPSVEKAETMAAEADSLYEVILDSEVPYTVADGYYRIFAHNRYKSDYDDSGLVDKAIAASYDKNHLNKIVYSTLNRDRANFLWKLTKSETGDSILMQNAGMGTYISLASIKENKLVTTDDPNQAAYVMFDYAGYDYVEPDGIGDEKDIFCIRITLKPRDGDNSYFHQNGHSSVNDNDSFSGNYGVDSGGEQEMAFWRRTWDYDASRADHWTSEWFLEFVKDSEAEEIIDAFEPIKNHDVLVARNNELRAEVLAALSTSKDLTLVTSASQLSSPYSDSAEGKNIGNLIDGDKSTFWHSDWHGTSPEGMYYNYSGVELECHYVQIADVQDMVGDCVMYWCERAGADNDRPSMVALMGSDTPDAADDEWEEMAVLEIPKFQAGEESTIPFQVEKAYRYVRVVVFDTDSRDNAFRKFWHAAEIQFYLVNPRPNSQFIALGQIAQNLQDTYDNNIELSDDEITVEVYETLLAAYKTFLAGMVDPTELRGALAAYANVTNGVVEGTNPGEWASTDVAKDYEALYTEVEAYDKAGRYNAVQNHKYAVMLKAMQKSVMEQANGIKTDKWYRIMFPTEEMFTNYGFNPTKVGGKSDLTKDTEEQAYMWGNFVAPGVKVSEDGYDLEGNEATITHLESYTKQEVREGESNMLFFFDDNDITDKDVSLFRFLERPQEEADYSNILLDVKENMQMALDMSTTYTRGDALITNASQLSSNASDSSEGLHIENLIDGNATTYWHSDYHTEVLEPGYIQVALNEPVSGFIQVDITRRNTSNGHIVRMFVQGSNDAENWSNVGYIETPFTSVNAPVTSQPINLGGTYKYLRFTMTNRSGTDGGSNTEFDPFAVISSKDDYNKLWSYFHAAEFQIYPVTPDKELNASGQALSQAYNVANRIVLKDATAADLAAAAQAYKAYRTDFNAIEGKAVLPAGMDKAAPVYAIQNKATGLFVNCKGSNNAGNSLETVPTFFEYSAPGFQRSFLHGKNIDGSNCSYLHSQNFDHRFVTWNDTQVDYNSGLVICEADETYEAPAEFTFYKSIKPGKIYNWCNSVTIVPEYNDDAAAYQILGRYQNDEGDFLALTNITSIPGGSPAFYIYGDTTTYDAEDDYVEPIKFTIPADEELTVKGETINGVIGCLTNHTLKPHEIYFSGNHAVCIGQSGYFISFNSAVVDMESCPDVDPDLNYDFSICLGEAGDQADGLENVSAAIEKISQPGNVYSTDGKLLRSDATLNSLKSMGKGVYILNGVKVMVK